MKTNQSRRKPLSIAKTRWAAYAAASAVSTLVGNNPLEAAIHYSGRVDATFPPHQGTDMEFQLDRSGDFLLFQHNDIFGLASFKVYGLQPYANAFRGYVSGFGDQHYVSKLSLGQDIATGRFQSAYFLGILAGGDFEGQWTDRGVGFIGFVFNNGAGSQYGWVRVKMAGSGGNNGFRVLDYAYADPGDRIRAGQKSANEMVTDEGSLGWLALGAEGLVTWRNSRSLSPLRSRERDVAQ